MSNDYYNAGSWPATGAAGASAPARAELTSITAGFAKLPTLTANGSKAVVVNSGATALEVTTGTLALAGNFATTGAYNTTLVQAASTTVTLPATNSVMARTDAAQTFAGVQTITEQPILSSLTASRAVFTDGSKGLVSNAVTGTGNVVMSASPTLTGTVVLAAATASGAITANAGVVIGSGQAVTTVGSGLIQTDTSDASDNARILVNGGGGAGNTRGAALQVNGNEYSGATGYAYLTAGDVAGAQLRLSAPNATGTIQLSTGGTPRAVLTATGGLQATWVPRTNLTYTPGDTTPSVADTGFMSISNSGAVTIGNFDDGEEGQLIMLFFNDSNTTVDRTNSVLSGSVSFVSSANDILTLRKTGSVWVEVARGVNG